MPLDSSGGQHPPEAPLGGQQTVEPQQVQQHPQQPAQVPLGGQQAGGQHQPEAPQTDQAEESAGGGPQGQGPFAGDAVDGNGAGRVAEGGGQPGNDGIPRNSFAVQALFSQSSMAATCVQNNGFVFRIFIFCLG